MTDATLFEQNPLGAQTTIDEVLDTFQFLDDWEERYAYVIDLGKKLPEFPDEEKTEQNKVHGCQSQVWLIHHRDPVTGKNYFLIDSDALIVRGLAALILCIFNGKTSDEIAQTDVDAIFNQLDLFRHISPTRGNGLRAMLEKMQTLARS